MGYQLEKVELASPYHFEIGSLTLEQRFEKVAEDLINRRLGHKQNLKKSIYKSKYSLIQNLPI